MWKIITVAHILGTPTDNKMSNFCCPRMQWRYCSATYHEQYSEDSYG